MISLLYIFINNLFQLKIKWVPNNVSSLILNMNPVTTYGVDCKMELVGYF